MSGPCVLSVLSLVALSLWVELGGGALTLSPAPLPQGSSREPQGFPAVPRILRRRRSWVWNQFFVLEESTGDEPVYIGKLHSDRDRGDGQVKYFLSGEGATSIFTINENTGDIHAAKRLDREQQAYYTLRAQVRDRNTNLLVEPESQFLIKVQDINDNAPRFMDGPYLARVAERSPVGTSVMTVAATDADDPTYGNSARLVYSMLQGQPYFSVESKTGVVRTALPDLDRETRDLYLLVIQAKDMMGQMGGLSATTSVTVTLTDVNDNPPQFTRKSYQFIVPESVLLSSVVATIKAVDQDEGPNAEVDYRILDGDGLGTFRIFTNPSTQEGLVTLHKMLDFETKSSYTLHIEAFNRHVDTRFLLAGPFTDVTTVQLLVQNVDEPPVFSPSVSRMVVSEGAPVGHYVGSVSAHDPDVLSSPIRYSIEQMSDAGRYFDIHSLSGVIRVIRRLDRESCALHNLTVVATESLDQLQVGRAVVEISVTDVNDNAPSFPIQYQTSVCERAQPGQLIATVSATDPDEPEHGHHFLFSLPAHTAVNHSLLLRDNSDNTASVLAAGVLRRDRLLLLPVVVSDGGRPPLSSTSTLTVSVCQCDPRGTRLRCPPGTPLHPAEPLLGVLALLAVVVVTAVIRRRREEPVMMDEERDIRENIVRYDDEGGGEEDTTSFNMSALRHQTPLLQAGPQTPLPQAGPQTPLLQAGPQTPLLPTGPQTPLLPTGPQTPLLQAGPQTPLLPTGPQTPLLQAGPQTPLLQAGPQTPLLPTGPQTPLLPAGPQTPLLPAGPQTPLLPTGPQTPLLPTGPQTPLLPAGPQTPLLPTGPQTLLLPTGPQTPLLPAGPQTPLLPTGPQTPLLPTGPQTPLLPAGPQTPLLPTGPQTPLLPTGPQTPLLPTGPQTPLLPTGPQTPLLPTGPQTPLLQAGPQTLLLPTGPQTPLLQAGPQTPLLPTGPQTPLLPTGPQTPLLQAGPQTPLLQAGPQTPLLPTGPQTPLLQAGPQTPLLQAGPQTPLLQAGPQTPLLPTGPQTPLLQAGPQTPLLQARPQTPLLPAGPQTPLLQAGPPQSLQDGGALREFIRLRLLETEPPPPPPDSLQTYAFEECSSAAESFSPPESPESPDSPESLDPPDPLDPSDSPDYPDYPDPPDPLDPLDPPHSGPSYTFLWEWGSRFSRLAELYGRHDGGGAF